MPLTNIDTTKSARSFRRFDGHPQATALCILQRRLLTEVDHYMTNKRAERVGLLGGSKLAQRRQSTIWALIELKRDLLRCAY
jgi:hypothetical protein